MATQANPDDQITTVDLKGPGGIGAAFSGSNTTVLLVLLFLVVIGAASAGMIYIFNQHDDNNNKHNAEMLAAIKVMTAAVEKNDKTQRETTEAMIWVLSKPQAEREKLDLSKPRFVAEMQR